MKQTAAPNTGFSVIARRTAAPYQEELCVGYAGRFLFEGVRDPKLTRNTVYYALVFLDRVIIRHGVIILTLRDIFFSLFTNMRKVY